MPELKWTEKLKQEFDEDCKRLLIRVQDAWVGDAWLAARSRVDAEVKKERERVLKLIEEHYTFREISGRYEMDMHMLRRNILERVTEP